MTSRKPHAGTTTRDGATWACSCGKDMNNTPGTLDEHHAAASKAAWRRLDPIEQAAVVAVSAGTRRDSKAVSMLTMFGTGWIYGGGRLLPYARTGYDGWGTLCAALDWAAILAALDAGKLAGAAGEHWSAEQDEFLLRVAASLCGYGAIRLSDLGQIPYRAQRDLRAAIADLIPDEG